MSRNALAVELRDVTYCHVLSQDDLRDIKIIVAVELRDVTHCHVISQVNLRDIKIMTGKSLSR